MHPALPSASYRPPRALPVPTHTHTHTQAGADARGMERGRLGAASHDLSVGEVGVCAVVEYACVHDPPRNYGLLGSVTCVGRGRVPVGTLILWARLAVPVSGHPKQNCTMYIH